MSRPEKKIDWVLVDKLLEADCTGTEIAPYFNMHPETFYDRVLKQYGIGFTEYSGIKKAHGDGQLRLAQLEKALQKDNTMMIWLGKQRLGQKEPETKPPEFKHDTDMDKMIEIWEKKHGSQQETAGQPQQLERKD